MKNNGLVGPMGMHPQKQLAFLSINDIADDCEVKILDKSWMKTLYEV